MLNEKWQLMLTDFGTAKKMVSSGVSSNSGNSTVSYVSGMSTLSAISGMGSKSAHANSSHSTQPADKLPEDFEEIVGSEFYISPEMVESRTYSYSSDLWALGVMIYQFFTGKLPFKGKNQDETFELIKKCEPEMPASLPEPVRDLVSKLLVKVPEDRLGAQNIFDV